MAPKTGLSGLRRLWRIGRRRSVAGLRNGELGGVVAELESMNHSTEADFLAITDKLMAFRSAARTISEEARAVADGISGEGGERASGVFGAVLDGARNMESHAQAARELVDLRTAVAHIRQTLGSFQHVGPSFQVMATLAQIETAHLGSAGSDLKHLADEFRAAGESIRSRVGLVLEGSGALQERIEGAIEHASEFEGRSLKTLPALVATCENGLRELRARREQASAIAGDLARRSGGLLKALGDVVASIQFHDITRQQVEHVIDALKSLDDDSAGVVIGLQRAQLGHATAALVDAVGKMRRRLESISDDVGAMAEQGRKLLGADGGGEETFYAGLYRSFGAIHETAGGCRRLEAGARKAVLEVSETLRELQASAGEIHSVELRLRRLAVNAAISSAHLGNTGEPLGAVASAMGALLAECERASAELDATIGSMADKARVALESAGDPAGAEESGVFDRLRGEMDEMHGLERRASERTRAMAEVAATLAEDVRKLLANCSAERVFAEATDRCCAALERLESEWRRTGDAPDGAMLASLERQYTMNSEREIHDAVIGSTEAEPAPEPEAVAATAGEFDDNVELF